MLALVTVSLVLSLISLPMAIIAFIELRAMKMSTHKIQYVPADDFKSDDGQSFLKKVYPQGDEDDQV